MILRFTDRLSRHNVHVYDGCRLSCIIIIGNRRAVYYQAELDKTHTMTPADAQALLRAFERQEKRIPSPLPSLQDLYGLKSLVRAPDLPRTDLSPGQA